MYWSQVRILQGSPLYLSMQKTKIKNIETGISKNCDILKKNDQILEIVIEGTTIKILLKKQTNYFLTMRVTSFYNFGSGIIRSSDKIV